MSHLLSMQIDNDQDSQVSEVQKQDLTNAGHKVDPKKQTQQPALLF